MLNFDPSSAAVSRRSLLSGAATAGLSLAVLGLTQTAWAAKKPNQPEAETGHDYPMPRPHAKSEVNFRMGVIGPATLSRMTSEMAVDKATHPGVKRFANFELREAIGVTTVLREMGTPVPPMDATARKILHTIQNTPPGAEFDKAYIQAQLANHEFLRDLATVYLANSAGHTSLAEMHGRHMAMLTLGQFKDHVVLTKDLLQELQA